MSKIAALREEVIAKQKAIAVAFEAKPDRDFNDEEVSDLRQKNAELNDLSVKLEAAQEIEDIASASTRQVKGGMPFVGAASETPAPVQVKSLGELFVESEAFTGFSAASKSGPIMTLDLQKAYGTKVAERGLKAVLNTTGYVPETTRVPGLFVGPGEQQPSIADMFAQGRTTQSSIVYMEETTATNAAAEVAESGTKPESTLAFTERTSPVRKIATVLPITDELMQDGPAIESYVNGRLGQFIAYREDTQLLGGDGIAPNLLGLLNTPNILTQAKGADSTPDAFYKAITKVGVTSFLPADGGVVHPNDWQQVRLLTTLDGVYIWGPPMDAGPSRIWGVALNITTAITEGTGVVGAFRAGGQVFRRSDVTFAVSDSHSDFFIKNQLMIRAEERLALVIYRPTAFCTVTGI